MMTTQTFDKRSGLLFIIAFGIVSFFADMAYEGMRGVSGAFLATLGASGVVVGIVAGLGELVGYALRLVSGRAADSTRAYWPIALFGYVIQMAAVPALALAGSWWLAAALIIVERTGKAIRNPPRDAMMARAGDHIGQGWAFGLHEALDQAGAMTGPLIAALVLALHHDYRAAFAWLGIPAVITLILVFTVCFRYPQAGAFSRAEKAQTSSSYSRAFWLYAAASALIAFGFADFTLIAFHFQKASVVAQNWIPLLYALAMAADGAASLAFGRWFDRSGLFVLIPGTILGAAVAPFAFFGGFWNAVIGTALWGIALGVHEAVMSAAVASLVPAASRARAYGVFTAIFGVAWFIGSAAMGALYDVSIPALVATSVVVEVLALVPLIMAMRAMRLSEA
jgi:predicted MFS family arabinose efflux permease